MFNLFNNNGQMGAQNMQQRVPRQVTFFKE